jgi:hypothetical protein
VNFALALGVLKEGLILWNTKESTKYLDRIIKLEKEYYEELSRSEDDRSQLALDKCMLDITTIGESFVKYRREQK